MERKYVSGKKTLKCNFSTFYFFTIDSKADANYTFIIQKSNLSFAYSSHRLFRLDVKIHTNIFKSIKTKEFKLKNSIVGNTRQSQW